MYGIRLRNTHLLIILSNFQSFSFLDINLRPCGFDLQDCLYEPLPGPSHLFQSPQSHSRLKCIVKRYVYVAFLSLVHHTVITRDIDLKLIQLINASPPLPPVTTSLLNALSSSPLFVDQSQQRGVCQ